MVVILAWVIACTSANAQNVTLVVRSTTIVDGPNGERPNATVLIDGDRIVSVLDALPANLPPSTRVIDGTGKWVTPGFVDVHVHEASEPYLRSMLAWGVTSIHLMPNFPPSSPLDMERQSEDGNTHSPRLQVTQMFTADFPDNLLPGVYQFHKPKTADEARETVQATRQNGYRQIKIIQDDGRLFSGDENFAPALEATVFNALIEEAHAQQMRVYVHATTTADMEMALEAGIEAFMHGAVDGMVDAEQWQRMTIARTVFTPTFHVLHWFGDQKLYAQRILEDPRLIARLPGDQREGLEAQANADAPIFLEVMQTLIDNTDVYEGTLATNTRNALNAGVTVAVGSDGGPAGVSTHVELALLQEAGLTPGEVLTAATSGGAAVLGRQNEIGTVEAGKLADLVVLNADPSMDVRNSREIEWVIKGGVVHAPSELVRVDPNR